MSGGFNYDVFLSYRHRPLDNIITKSVFNLLESYRLPKPLRARGCRDIDRVFRDAEELAVSKILTETIDDALRSSNCLVVICTTAAPLSPWVDREVSMFIKMGRADYIYPLLVNGDPELTEYLEALRDRPELRMLFSTTRNATKEDIEKTVRIIEALRGGNADT